MPPKFIAKSLPPLNNDSIYSIPPEVTLDIILECLFDVAVGHAGEQNGVEVHSLRDRYVHAWGVFINYGKGVGVGVGMQHRTGFPPKSFEQGRPKKICEFL